MKVQSSQVLQPISSEYSNSNQNSYRKSYKSGDENDSQNLSRKGSKEVEFRKGNMISDEIHKIKDEGKRKYEIKDMPSTKKLKNSLFHQQSIVKINEKDNENKLSALSPSPNIKKHRSMLELNKVIFI